MRGRVAVLAALMLGGLLLPDAGAVAAPRERAARRADASDVSVEGPPAPAPARVSTPSPETAYARRESAAKNLEGFKGGGAGIYIGGSTLAVVLIIVLIIVIL